ncbi:MAG: alanine--glyoxylate aminotransferase family protein [Bacteroidota bacterium]
MKQRLFTPGPTPIPEEVLSALSRPIIHHRQADFKEIFRRASADLKYLFQTNEDVVTLTASGTGAMEAAVVNLLSSGDSAIYVDGGKFGERWGHILKQYSVTPIPIKVEWGSVLEAETVRETLLRHPKAKAVFLTHSETSTGTAIDLKRISETVNNSSKALIVVDGISSIGALEVHMDAWGIDVLLTGSQKGLMLPPGLSFIAFSQRAGEVARTSSLPKFYFDLERAWKTVKEMQTPWTPAISLIVGLDVALQMIRQEGLPNVWMRHDRLARAVREGCAALGLVTFSKSPSNSITAIRMPEGIDGEALRSQLRKKHGIVVAGGQDHLKGKVIRIAHLGYFDDLDIIAVVAALGMAMEECVGKSNAGPPSSGKSGGRFDQGAAVEAALRALSQPLRHGFELRYT